MSEGPQWYAVQTQARHENRVSKLIQQEIDKDAGPNRPIREVMVPTHEVVEIRRGKRVTVVRPSFPGYVLVRMLLNEATKHVISGMKGVRFVAHGREPEPVAEDDMKRILGIEVEDESRVRDEIPFRVGQVVEVIGGPFSEFSGTVQEVYPEKGKVKVEVSLFGRPTSVELDFTQLKGF